MKKGDFICRPFLMRAVLAGFILGSGLFLFACSKAAPKCDSGGAVDAVIHEVSQDMKKDFNYLASAGTGELTEDEWRTMRAGIMITVVDIREQNFDKDTDRRTCAGNLVIQEAAGKESIPITYIPETDKASGGVKVTLSGYQEHKNKKTAPLISGDQ